MLTGATSDLPELSDINQFSFVNMQNGTTISVSYNSSGCFHSDSGVMTFTPEAISYAGETKTVSLQDMVSLDKYFRNLSAKQGQFGGCTSSTRLNLTLNREDKAVGQIALKDDFCFRGEDMLAPNALKYKLFEKEKTEQLTLIEK